MRDQSSASSPLSFEQLAESMPQLVWIANDAGFVDYYNGRITRYAGAERRADGTWVWQPLLADEDVAPTMVAWESSVATGGVYTMEHRVRMADGSMRWHLSRAEPVVDNETGRVRWYGTATDIHDAKVVQEQLRRAMGRLHLLQEVTALLAAPIWSEGAVAGILVDQGILPAGASAAAVALRRADGSFEVIGSGGYPPGAGDRWQRFPDRPGLPLSDAISTGSIVAMADPASVERMYPHFAADLASTRHHAWAVVPFPRSLGPVGGMFVTFEAPHEMSTEERSALQTVAELGAQALQRVATYRREHEIATTLQHAMLGQIDFVPDLCVGAAYLASSAGLDIGGDWYDVVDRSDGTIVLVVGDVVGHSLEAATAMGQLRSVARSLARLCDDPGTLLEQLERDAVAVPEARHATAAVVYLELDSGRFRYVCAGHPPPLLIGADGQAAYLDDGRGTPLGSFLRRAAEPAEGRLEPGGKLVLFTDGLVERRGEGIDEGLDRLCSVAAAEFRCPPESLVARLVGALAAEVERRDDVAVLAVESAAPGTWQRRFLADARQLSEVRRDLRRHLTSIGVEDPVTDDVVLLAGEALANAVEHAYLDRPPGLVTIRVTPRERELQVLVADDGAWREPPAPGDRGRGAVIMGRLSAQLTVERGVCGTRVHATFRTEPDVAHDGGIPRPKSGDSDASPRTSSA